MKCNDGLECIQKEYWCDGCTDFHCRNFFHNSHLVCNDGSDENETLCRGRKFISYRLFFSSLFLQF